MKNNETKGVVLIVDDELDNLRLLSQLLSGRGYSVRAAKTGIEALSSIQSAPPDLVLLDIRLPDISGYEVCAQLKSSEATRDLPVLFLSALKETDEILRGFAVGAVDYIAKPFQAEEVLARVKINVEMKQIRAIIEQNAVDLQFANDQIQIELAERKRAEVEKVELEAQNRQLQKADSLGRMAGAIAHHFNNQLYAVMGNLEIAMDDLPLGVNSNESLVSAMQAARKAADVSRLMLTYLGQTSGKKEPVDLSEACRTALTLLQAAAPKGMLLKSDFPSSGPIIHADSGQMHQILTNLITNAWESISDNRGAIGMTVKTVSHADIPALKCLPIDWQPKEIVYACLEVSDNGCGISNKDIENIFDPFFTTKFTGRGLGLPVVMGILKAHGGGVTVESEQGRGSVFRVFLLLEELPIQHGLPATSEALLADKAEKTSKIEGGGTVLLIEDEEPVRNIAKKMLTRLGYTVLEAKDGVEAVEIFRQHQDEICCVLSDLAMPRMDGWDTLDAMRKLSPDITVILSSGYDEAKVMAGEHPERPNAFLGKPYQLKRLSDTISRVLTAPVHL
jgi:two-component system cell cycle sensor histidine kinase/response regulator CckA